ncbi:sigma-70 family RNA polymerase sigma factor [Microbacterium foliorum]|uniref:Sigma-70 family RNA polymerase sigma factor n=1 Tax=Microbacterium foliorum TaxID=104336 RepID=A0A4Y5YNA8_9MICO|nr:sigma-70 family RNA polymerase sigma factor [Microbacterium foliorum]QDE34174.1 sigma-70 family RNA polymerase sigma factor [Microbacterium foliorum]
MTVDQDSTSHDETIADADLVLRTRSGDAAAFGELWRRHYPSGMSVARSITSSIDPDDLVQESYTRIYQAIIKGGGPNGSFRAYLFTSIRNTAAAWGRSRRESAIDELDSVADPDSTDQAANEALDRSLTAQAFRSLPSRWQEVLWYTEIEQMKPQEAATLLGMKAGAVSQLAFRAREGLREAWIQAHLRSAAAGSDCQWTIEHLGAYSRGNLSTRDHNRLEQHLDECARCMIVAAEAKDVSTRLALVLLPLVLGVTGAAGYLATLQGGGTPIVALAAMPSGITEGAVVVTGAATGGSSSSTAGGGAAGGGAAGGGAAGGGAAGGGAGSAASGGIFSGVGALVGAGSAALVVAGVVAAATIVPTLAGVTPVASLPSAGDRDSSSISSDVGPDESMSDEKTPVDDDVEPEPEPEPVTPPVDAPITPQPSEDIAPAIVAAPSPVETSKPSPEEDVPEEGTPGEETPGEETPGEETPGEETPGEETPGEETPGEETPGEETPGEETPGEETPGEETPGEETPGEETPGEETPGEETPGEETPGEETPGEPAAPTTPIVVTLADICLDGRAITYVTLNVSGDPGADIEALLDGSHGGADSTSLSDAGTGTIELRPGLVQIILGATVEIHYVTAAGPLLPVTTSLSALGVNPKSVLLAPACGAPAEDAVETTPVPTPDDTAVPVPEPTDVAAPAGPDETAPATVVETPDAEVVPETPAPEPAAPVEPSAPTETAPPVEPTVEEETAPVDETSPAVDAVVPAAEEGVPAL